jgi:hypothetical protein
MVVYELIQIQGFRLSESEIQKLGRRARRRIRRKQQQRCNSAAGAL